MRTLTPAERRAFRARAHHLRPVVSIGAQGLTPAVLHEIGNALAARELIKIRVFDDDRDARESLLARICEALDAAPVQHLGKVLTVFRPVPEPAVARERPAKPSPARRDPPRGPEPRAAARPRRRRPSSLAARGKPAAGPGAPGKGGRSPRAAAVPGARRRRSPR